jgi:hypothetical protein
MPTTHSSKGTSSGLSLYGLYVLSLATCLVGNLIVRLGERGGWLPASGRVATAVLSTLPLVVTAMLFWRLLRSELDEMFQRIVLEGLALALVISVPLTAIYSNLRTAGVWTPRIDPADLLLAPAVLAAIGIAVSWRRHA